MGEPVKMNAAEKPEKRSCFLKKQKCVSRTLAELICMGEIVGIFRKHSY